MVSPCPTDHHNLLNIGDHPETDYLTPSTDHTDHIVSPPQQLSLVFEPSGNLQVCSQPYSAETLATPYVTSENFSASTEYDHFSRNKKILEESVQQWQPNVSQSEQAPLDLTPPEVVSGSSVDQQWGTDPSTIATPSGGRLMPESSGGDILNNNSIDVDSVNNAHHHQALNFVLMRIDM